ncbi:hypothetical protein [Mycobacteroides abscessus]|uniref:hypothetical protein n=1 Tax=Mycobacteroides abscessus TaxID=36809 RepID=UPI0012FFF758|nr:hypothetical protein [Mycobacteroides abscessus]MDO3030723.1 hypothetical protein [Mycobacteroides abscessus subsp. massiliense]
MAGHSGGACRGGAVLDMCVPVTYVAGDYAPIAEPWARIADQLRPGMLKQLRAD